MVPNLWGICHRFCSSSPFFWSRHDARSKVNCCESIVFPVDSRSQAYSMYVSHAWSAHHITSGEGVIYACDLKCLSLAGAQCRLGNDNPLLHCLFCRGVPLLCNCTVLGNSQHCQLGLGCMCEPPATYQFGILAWMCRLLQTPLNAFTPVLQTCCTTTIDNELKLLVMLLHLNVRSLRWLPCIRHLNHCPLHMFLPALHCFIILSGLGRMVVDHEWRHWNQPRTCRWVFAGFHHGYHDVNGI